MLKTLLVGLDGSPCSLNAGELAIDWARRPDAMVVGLGIVDEPTIRGPEMVPIGAGPYKQRSDDARFHHATQHVDQILERFSLRCTEAAISSKVLKDVGEPYEAILRQAQRYDIILLGQQTHFHFATQEGPCETLKNVLQSTPRPVVAVPEKGATGTSVVVAVDGSLQAARALQAFQQSGLDAEREVNVVGIGTNYVEVARHTDRAVEFLGFHGIRARVHVLESADSPGDILLDWIRRLDAGMVVMGAYGKSAIREFFLGSVTRTLLAKSPVPLFLYH